MRVRQILTAENRQRLRACSARARNDSFLISGAADPSPLWGNGPGQRDRGEPGLRSPLALRCRGLEGRSAEPAVRALGAAWRWEAETLRSSLARSPQYATANKADVKKTLRCALQRRQPFRARRTFKTTPRCALPRRQPFPTWRRAAGRGAGSRRAPARSARPSDPGGRPAPSRRHLGPRPRGRGRTGRVGAARGALGRRGPQPASRPTRPPSRARSRWRLRRTGEGAAKRQHPARRLSARRRPRAPVSAGGRPWAREPAPPAPGGPASQVSYPLPLFLLRNYQNHELKFANQFL